MYFRLRRKNRNFVQTCFQASQAVQSRNSAETCFSGLHTKAEILWDVYFRLRRRKAEILWDMFFRLKQKSRNSVRRLFTVTYPWNRSGLLQNPNPNPNPNPSLRPSNLQIPNPNPNPNPSLRPSNFVNP